MIYSKTQKIHHFIYFYIMIQTIMEKHLERFHLINNTLVKHGYEYERALDNGGFSTCHLVYSEQYQMTFVCKIIKNDKTIDNIPEIDIVSSLNHPNIIRIYHYFKDDEFIYIIMEYCSGGTLQSYVKKNGRLHGDLLLVTCKQILEAVKFCHDMHIAHRDIKPSNILIDNYGRPKLADFGLSSIINENATKCDQIGSLIFLAPEIVKKENYDPYRTDIWALGITFYFLVNGTYPWSSIIKKDIAMEIKICTIDFAQCKTTPEFRLLLKKMLAYQPLKRPTIEVILKCDLFTQSDIKLGSISKASSFCSEKGFSSTYDDNDMEHIITRRRRRHISTKRHSYNIPLCTSSPISVLKTYKQTLQPTFVI
ncbi:AGC family protein kinase [Tritrichomonas foetus]|uniref:AGC family protein kinase n=1 Tax=Tritrichomonas foetus TaxID=1144522 RepID=A0A1J4K212_9EUKA|nr:AGC family protein kinase [Tritrichomonas foetus]|eukprot:OHT05275.1 AGC family protein kinase [Tritrichomonas foetus]